MSRPTTYRENLLIDQISSISSSATKTEEFVTLFFSHRFATIIVKFMGQQKQENVLYFLAGVHVDGFSTAHAEKKSVTGRCFFIY